MNLSLNLSPETEASLIAQAAREGQPPEVVALNAIREKLAEQSGTDPSSDSDNGSIDTPVEDQKIKAAKAIAEELGFVILETEVECDPDDSQGAYVSLCVEAPSSMSDILAAHMQWHTRQDAVLGDDHSSIRLCVFPAPR